MKIVKESLEWLLNLDKNEYDRVIKAINPKVEDSDLKPIFPEGWSNDNRWPAEDTETPAERWKRWEPHQIRIDYELERMMGCYDTDEDC